MLAVPSDSVWKLTLRKAGREQTVVRRESGEWQALGAAGARVDAEAVGGVLARCAGLRALRIEAESMKSPAAYGLDDSAVELTLGLSGSGGIQKTLRLGYRARTDGLYAAVQGQDMVFVLAEAEAEKLGADLLLTGDSPDPAGDAARP
jgi:hypothetical protein